MTPEETEFYTEIGKRVTAYRTMSGYTQHDLADKAGIVRSSIANLEAGRQAVPLHKLDTIAKTLGVTVASLLPGVTLEGRALEVVQTAQRARAALDEFLSLLPSVEQP